MLKMLQSMFTFLTRCKKEKEEVVEPFIDVSSAIAYVESFEGKPKDFRLPIADQLNDAMGINMTIITDTILAKEFMPNGFKQQNDTESTYTRSSNRLK